MLREIENLVAEAVEVNVPFSNPITYAYPFLTHSELPLVNGPWQWLCRIYAQGGNSR
jgi:hypothetical protein